MKASEPAKIYQFKITINNIHPPVWRRILMSDKSTLLDIFSTTLKNNFRADADEITTTLQKL